MSTTGFQSSNASWSYSGHSLPRERSIVGPLTLQVLALLFPPSKSPKKPALPEGQAFSPVSVLIPTKSILITRFRLQRPGTLLTNYSRPLSACGKRYFADTLPTARFRRRITTYIANTLINQTWGDPSIGGTHWQNHGYCGSQQTCKESQKPCRERRPPVWLLPLSAAGTPESQKRDLSSDGPVTQLTVP